MRLFLDANVLFSASLGSKVRVLWDRTDVELVMSEYAAREAHENLLKKADESAIVTMTSLLERVIIVPHNPEELLFVSWQLPDPNDVPILSAAIESNCEFLITGDKACFGHLYGTAVDGVTVLNPRQFNEQFPPPG